MTILDNEDINIPSPIMHWQPADGPGVRDTYHRIREVVKTLMLIEEKCYDMPSLRKFVRELNASFTHCSYVEKQLGNMIREQYNWQGRNQRS